MARSSSILPPFFRGRGQLIRSKLPNLTPKDTEFIAATVLEYNGRKLSNDILSAAKKAGAEAVAGGDAAAGRDLGLAAGGFFVEVFDAGQQRLRARQAFLSIRP